MRKSGMLWQHFSRNLQKDPNALLVLHYTLYIFYLVKMSVHEMSAVCSRRPTQL